MQLRTFSILAGALLVKAQSDPWSDAYSKASTALSKLSLSEKVGIVTGTKWQGGPCVGTTTKPNSINYPSLCLQDGPLGVRFANPVTAFPAGINAGATWDISLIKARGTALGAEAKGLGVHNLLGPGRFPKSQLQDLTCCGTLAKKNKFTVAGPLGKNALGGRNWEGFGGKFSDS
jgi:beta-glucosidase